MLVLRQLQEYGETSSARRVKGHDKRYIDYIRRYLLRYHDYSNGTYNRLTFLSYLSQEDLAMSTKATIAQSLTRFLYHYGYLNRDDVEIIHKSFRQPLPDWSKSEVNEENIARLITYFQSRGGVFTSVRNTAVLVILSTVGMRISQLLEMERSKLKFSPTYVQFTFPSKKQVAVNDDEKYDVRNIMLSHNVAGKPVKYYLDTYLEVHEHYKSPWLICNLKGDQLTQTYFQKELRKATDRLDLPHITPHSFRHYVGNKLANEKGLLMAHKVLGHTDLNTTRRYLKNDADTLIY